MKIVKVPDIIKETSRKLRKDMTVSETILWNKLKTRKLYGKKFIRQCPIYVFTENSGLDRFIISDFVCKSEKIIIELDGSIHELKEIYLLDIEKEKLLKNIGYKVIRFKNNEILNNLNNSLEKIAFSLHL